MNINNKLKIKYPDNILVSQNYNNQKNLIVNIKK